MTGVNDDRTTDTNLDSPCKEIDRFPGLWRRFRRKKLLEIAGSERVLEIDAIIASVEDWDQCEERHEPGWDVVVDRGVVFAEKSTC